MGASINYKLYHRVIELWLSITPKSLYIAIPFTSPQSHKALSHSTIYCPIHNQQSLRSEIITFYKKTKPYEWMKNADKHWQVKNLSRISISLSPLIRLISTDCRNVVSFILLFFSHFHILFYFFRCLDEYISSITSIIFFSIRSIFEGKRPSRASTIPFYNF
jgi:hypothetical protein